MKQSIFCTCSKNKTCNCRYSKSRFCTGYLYAVLASIASACGTLFYKITDENKMKVVLARMSLQYLLLLPILQIKKVELGRSKKTSNILLLLAGLLSPLSMIFMGLSLNYLTVGDAVAVFYSYPSLVTTFACLCLKEKCGILDAFLICLTIIGFTLIAQPSFLFDEYYNNNSHSHTPHRMLGLLLAFVASLCVTGLSLSVRTLGQNVHFLTILLYSALIGAFVSLVCLFFSGKSLLPCQNSLLFMLGCSICYILSQSLQTLALQHEKAGPVTVIQTTQVVFSFLLQYVFLQEIPNNFCAIGASLILFSCIALGSKKFLNCFSK